MSKSYRDIVLWGHGFEEYKRMFNLTEAELKLAILDCCGGPSSFNAVLTQQGGHVVSTDKLFALAKPELSQKIASVFTEMLETIELNRDRFTWNEICSPQELAADRQKNIKLFLNDFEKGIKECRYLADTPPDLPFKHYQFDLALCSHYFFANSPDQSVEFHVKAIKNLCDVAKEVRIFPLLDSKGEIPAFVGSVTQAFNQAGMGVEIKTVPYRFQAKGNAMLRVWAQTCELFCDI